jgi:hypothetical protein
MAKNRGETLDLLHSAYEALTKAGRNSLAKAYTFGNVVNALHGIFSYSQLAAEIGVTPTTISTYAKLYRRYPNEQLLMHTAAELGTYDVSRLASESESIRYVYNWHCNNCGSYDVKKERQTAESMAARESAAVASVKGAEALRTMTPAEALDAGSARK